MWKRGENHHSLFLKSECSEGMPSWDFEKWFMLGDTCYRASLSKAQRKVAFKCAVETEIERDVEVLFWQIRAFVLGSYGYNFENKRTDPGFAWPTPPSPEWQIVVRWIMGKFDYEIDLFNRNTRTFMLGEGKTFPLPGSDKTRFNRDWFRELGFVVLDYQ